MSTSFSALFWEAQKRSPGPNQYDGLSEQSFLFPDDSAPIRGVRELTLPPEIGRFVLIGVAVFSLPELELLDAIVEQRRRHVHQEEELQVFDILTCQQADFEERIPGIEKVVATPLVGIWSDGVLVESTSGYKAVKALRKHYALSEQFRRGPGFGWPYV